MYRILSGLYVIGLLLSSSDSLAADETANATYIVEFQNGRRAKASIDPQTDEHQLWLQFGSSRVRLTRGVAWDDVALFDVDGQPISREEALKRSQQAAALVPKPTTRKSLHTITVPTKRDAAEPRPTPRLPADTRTQFVRFDAQISNWDDDVECDGLMVQVIPFAGSGARSSVRGQLHVELWSMRRVDYDSAPHVRGRSLEILQRWSQPIAIHADDSYAWVNLPFQARHPEFDVSWSSIGLVHIELVAPGQGVFHHSIDSIRVRPFAPLRDALQVQTGERFFPTELNRPK